LLSVAAAFARAIVSRDGADPVASLAGAAGSLHLDIGLHFGLGHLGFVVPREAVVWLEANGRTDLELDRGEHLLHLTREVRVFQELADLFGNDAEEAVLRFFDLREEVIDRLARQFHAADEFLQVVRGLGGLFDANLDGSLDELGNDAVEAAAPVARVLLAHEALAPGKCKYRAARDRSTPGSGRDAKNPRDTSRGGIDRGQPARASAGTQEHRLAVDIDRLNVDLTAQLGHARRVVEPRL